MPVAWSEAWIPTKKGGKLYAHLHYPEGRKDVPAVVFVPGGASCGADYDKSGAEIQPKDLAALGFVVVHYDPSGRGSTGGEENYWGTEHQDELVDVLRWTHARPEVQKNNVVILSFSIGITIAAGALARYADELPFVSWLFDWEGPSSRFNITKNDTHPPLKSFPTSNDAFWQEREPCRFINKITCGYFRYQALQDHVQGNKKEHALELVNLATQGTAAWTQLNHTPRNRLHTVPVADQCWVQSKKTDRLQLLRSFLSIAEGEAHYLRQKKNE
ncbi:Serine aminopeptidase S33 domain-containing protein [Candidatus Electrothrix laxa]